jgi:hypothetical protein
MVEEKEQVSQTGSRLLGADTDHVVPVQRSR